MKRTAFALLALVLSGTAVAGDLINKDGKKYDYRLSCGGGTTSTSISGTTTQSGKVKKGCVIELGGAKYTVKGDKAVFIKGGSLSE